MSPDGTRVVYLADSIVDERLELHAVRVDGATPPVLLSGTIADGGDVLDAFEITADSTRVVFGGDLVADDVFELFVAPLDRAKAVRRLNAPLVPGGDAAVELWTPVPSFALSQNGEVVLYRADQERDGFLELFMSFLDRPLRRGGETPLAR